MKTKKRKPRKLLPADAAKYLAEATLPEGWTSRLLAEGEKIPDGGWETVQAYKPYNIGDHDCCPWIAFGLVENADKSIRLVFKFEPEAPSYGGEGKPAWRVTVRGVSKHHGGEPHTKTEIIQKGKTHPNARATAKGAIERATMNLVDAEVLSVEEVSKTTVHYSGTTAFDIGTSTFNFDRRGVGDSFYGDDQRYPSKNLAELVAHEEKRAREAIERRNRSEAIPAGFGFILTPEAKAEKTKQLKAGRPVEFRPSGFGIGKRLYPKPSRHARPVATEVAKFFGFDQLWVEEFDCD